MDHGTINTTSYSVIFTPYLLKVLEMTCLINSLMKRLMCGKRFPEGLPDAGRSDDRRLKGNSADIFRTLRKIQAKKHRSPAPG